MGRIDHDIELLRQQIDAQRTLTRTQWVLMKHEFQDTAEKTRSRLKLGRRLGSLVAGAFNMIKFLRGGSKSSGGKRSIWQRVAAGLGVATSAVTLFKWLKHRRSH